MPLSCRFLVGAMIAAATAFNPALADVKTGVEAWQRGNYAGAVREWRPLAEKGDADAQFNLAQAYKLGRGVPADLKVAQGWYEKAAQQNHEEAQANLGLILFQNGEQEAGIVWIRKASDNGDPRARYVLATALFNGDMMAKDWPLAYALMSRAAAQGVEPASDSLAQMENLLPESQRQQGMKLLRELARKDADRDIAAGRMAPIASTPPPAPAASPALPEPAPEPVRVAAAPAQQPGPAPAWSPPEESVAVASATTPPPTAPAITPTWNSRKSRQRPQRQSPALQPAATPPPPAPVDVASSIPPIESAPSLPAELVPSIPPPVTEQVAVASTAAPQEPPAMPAPTELAGSPPPDTAPSVPAETAPTMPPSSAEPVAVASATPPQEAAAAPGSTELASIDPAVALPSVPPGPAPAPPLSDPPSSSAESAPVTPPADISSTNPSPETAPTPPSAAPDAVPPPAEPAVLASATPPKKRAAPARKPAAPAPRIATGGHWRVQLGAYASIDLAQGQWSILRTKIGVLDGLQPSYESFGSLTRLRVNSLADRAAAEKLCAAAKAAGQGCFAIAP